MKLGFVGLGNMGAPMACNLSKAADVVAYDRNIEKRKKHVAKSGRATDNLIGHGGSRCHIPLSAR